MGFGLQTLVVVTTKQAKATATADYVEAPTRVRMYAPRTMGERIADRASATIDLEHDRADRSTGTNLRTTLRVLWGAHGTVGQCFDVLSLWDEIAEDVTGRALDCGHYIAEEQPAELLREMLGFFKEQS